MCIARDLFHSDADENSVGSVRSTARGMVSGFSVVIAEESARTRLPLPHRISRATAVGYFIQGWFKFGGVEYFKINAAQSMTEQEAG